MNTQTMNNGDIVGFRLALLDRAIKLAEKEYTDPMSHTGKLATYSKTKLETVKNIYKELETLLDE